MPRLGWLWCIAEATMPKWLAVESGDEIGTTADFGRRATDSESAKRR
jgi:hypothetical protein